MLKAASNQMLTDWRRSLELCYVLVPKATGDNHATGKGRQRYIGQLNIMFRPAE